MQPAVLLEHCDGQILFASENLVNFFGLSAQPPQGAAATEFWNVAASACEESDAFLSTANAARDMHCSLVGEPFALRDGRRIERDCHPQHAAAGASTVLWLFHDITHREEFQPAPHKDEQRYTFTLDGVEMGIWDWNLETDAIRFDERWAEMLGYERKPLDLTIKQVLGLIHAEDRPRFDLIVGATRRGERPDVLPEYRFRCRDGSYKWMLARGSVVAHDKSGKATRAVGVHTDITEFKRVEEALRQSQARLQELFQSITQGVVIVDAQGRIEDANRVALDALGVTLEEAAGRHACDSAWDPRGEDGSPMRAEDHPVSIAIRTAATVRRELSGRSAQGGDPIWISCVAIPRIRLGETHPSGAYAIFDDITERRRTERERAALLDVLSLVNSPGTELDLMRAVVQRLRSWTGCTAVGIRVREGHDFPYYVSSGYTPEFIRAESSLCQSGADNAPMLDPAGEPRLACVCGQVLRGELDYPEDYVTPLGSFWVRSVTEFSAKVPPERLPATLRGRCVGMGYQSVALIPLRVMGETFGLLQLDDLRPNHFDRRDIDLFERLAAEVALAFSQRRTALALRDAEERLRSVVTHAGEGILLVDAHERFEFANPAAESIFGADGLIGRSIHDFLDAQQCAYILRSASSSNTAPSTLEAEIHRGDGETRALLLTIVPEANESGAFLRAFVVARDITRRKRGEEALRLSESRLRESQRISQIGSYDFDAERGEWVSSETLDEIFGITADFPHNVDNWLALIHPEQRQEMADYFLHDVIGKRQPFDRQYRIVRPSDGAVRWMHGRGALSFSDEGQAVRMIGTISDITERKSFEEQLLEARKMESIGRLAGGIAHDFNNILTVINGYSDLLLSSMADSDPLRPHVAEVRGAGERASELTHQLLAFSRRQMLELRVINLNELVRQIERWLLRLIGEHVHLSTTLDENLQCVRADAGQMNQVLINLALNARDAMPQGGWLHLQTSNVEVTQAIAGGPGPGRYVQLTVSDNGVGMSDETRTRLFEPFFTTKGHGSGTGLGLSTVYGIVQQCGGWITVDSHPGEGSTFAIFLPPVSEIETPDEAVLPATQWARGGRILLVEDQAGVRGLASRILTGLGFHVEEAESGEQALEMASASSTSFDLVLTDIVMPGMSGRELVDELKLRGLKMRVLFMSGYTDDVLVQYGVDHGAGFLQKPFTPEGLATKVREVLGENAE